MRHPRPQLQHRCLLSAIQRTALAQNVGQRIILLLLALHLHCAHSARINTLNPFAHSRSINAAVYFAPPTNIPSPVVAASNLASFDAMAMAWIHNSSSSNNSSSNMTRNNHQGLLMATINKTLLHPALVGVALAQNLIAARLPLRVTHYPFHSCLSLTLLHHATPYVPTSSN